MQVGDRGFDNANRVEAKMVIEEAILSRQQSLNQIWRHIAQRDFYPFCRCVGQQPADNLRLEHRLRLRRTKRIGDSRDAFFGKTEMNDSRRRSPIAEPELTHIDRYRPWLYGVFTRMSRLLHPRVTELFQTIDQVERR